MAADTTYQPKTYRRAGGDETVIADGGKLIVESGGTLELEAGALVTGLTLTASVVAPDANGGAALGSTALMWSDLFLASGGVINFNDGDVTLTHSLNTLTLAGGGLALGSTLAMPNDAAFTIGTTTATAETKITMSFDESLTGIGLFNMGSTSVPMVLATNPGSGVIAHTVNILHSAGAGDCDDLIASYEKCAVSGDGDSGLTLVGTASRAYVGTAVGSTTVAKECYGAQPWVSHYGTGAITAMSGLSAKCDVNTGNFTASTVDAGHFHVEGAATVTSAMFDGVMIEIYPDVTCLDAGLRIVADTGSVVTNAIKIGGTASMTYALAFDAIAGCCATNTAVPAVAPAWDIVLDMGGTPGYIPVYSDRTWNS